MRRTQLHIINSIPPIFVLHIGVYYELLYNRDYTVYTHVCVIVMDSPPIFRYCSGNNCSNLFPLRFLLSFVTQLFNVAY